MEMSLAAETKLATMLMPTVAVTKVKVRSRAMVTLSIWATISSGSSMTLPKTSGVPLMVMTAIIEKKVKFTGRR